MVLDEAISGLYLSGSRDSLTSFKNRGKQIIALSSDGVDDRVDNKHKDCYLLPEDDDDAQ